MSGWAGSRPLDRFGKRALDVLLATCGLLAFSPILAISALLIRITMGPPVLFRQSRPGRGGRPFEIIKFRTMTDQRGPDGQLAPGRDRVTRVGALLRRTSLDELPELWNVLRGEMSIVGPRPLLMEFLAYYTPDQLRRHDVRPGLTGWAQIHGRRSVEMQERIALDVWYVDHWSWRLDARIMLATIGMVLRGEHAEPTQSVPTAELGWASPDERQGPATRWDDVERTGS
jgi:lipopolysaccharide/colanic/teichoic acid biosynthesis glycosyltransferase